MSNSRLQDKIALVTGASSGIGSAMTRLFARQGAQVVAISRRDDGLDQWGSTTNVWPVRADITRQEDIDRMFETAEQRFGHIDVVCNVAGINDLGYPLDETSDARWDQVVDLDLKAPFRICRRAITPMVKRGRGVILNVGSYAAGRGNHGPSYTAAKHGLVGLSLSIAVAYAKHGIRCNVVNPGAVRTQIEAHSGGSYHPAGLKMFKDIIGNLPIELMCDPEDVARTALFLCSDEAKHVNGAIVAVDGGMSAC